jgi:hypothetical protein
LSLDLYLDDCAYDKLFVAHLTAAGHRVVTPAQAGTTGQDDAVHLSYAAARGLALITKDADDFAALHAANPMHAGILAVCQDNDPTRDMTHADIVRAIANLETAGVPIAGEYHILNHWQY